MTFPKKKILFISSVSSVSRIPLWNAFEYLGFEVYFVDYRGNSILMPGNLIHRAIGRLPQTVKHYLYDKGRRAVDRTILNAAREIKPDYIFVTKAKYIAISTLDELRTIAPTINWYSDMMSNWGSIQAVIDHYDYFFNYDRYVINLLQSQGHKNSYHLPWAGYLQKTDKWPDKKDYKYNITFIGSYHPELFPREASFKGLKELGLNIWGNKEWFNTPLRDCYRGYIMPSKGQGQGEVQKVYQESKIGLYFDSLYDTPGTGITLRPFEITSAGSMMLGQVYREELPELFQAGKEFVSFAGISELKEKAKYYLEHESEREKIARNGFERARNEHTYIDRMKKVFEVVENNPRKI